MRDSGRVLELLPLALPPLTPLLFALPLPAYAAMYEPANRPEHEREQEPEQSRSRSRRMRPRTSEEPGDELADESAQCKFNPVRAVHGARPCDR